MMHLLKFHIQTFWTTLLSAIKHFLRPGPCNSHRGISQSYWHICLTSTNLWVCSWPWSGQISEITVFLVQDLSTLLFHQPITEGFFPIWKSVIMQLISFTKAKCFYSEVGISIKEKRSWETNELCLYLVLYNFMLHYKQN